MNKRLLHILCNSIECKNKQYVAVKLLRQISTTNTHKHQDTTVDQADVQRHGQQMKSWWDPNGPMKALHAMNMLRIPFIRDGMTYGKMKDKLDCRPLSGTKVLDVGCGGGILSECLARMGAEVTGIDASNDLILLAREHAKLDPKLAKNRPTYFNLTVEAFNHTQDALNKFDAVIASEVIEHVKNQPLFVKSCVEVTKPGGFLFFTTPNRTRVSQIAGIYVAEYILKILPKGTHNYEKFITPTELSFLLERNCCHVQALYGMMYNFITNKWTWSHSTAFVYALQAKKAHTE